MLLATEQCVIVMGMELTVHVDHDPLADGGRDPVRGYTEVRSHLGPRDLGKFQDLPLV
jgi:hypothetical protein